jgi:NAD-dependent dihydropyrimidine dehydrogenase PreA subunit
MKVKNENETLQGQVISIDLDKCVRCMKCVTSCPTGAITIIPNPVCNKCVGYCLTMPVSCYRENVIVRPELCNGCISCIEICTAGAIHWKKIL